MKRILIMETGSFKVIGGAAKDTLRIFKALGLRHSYEIDLLGDYSEIDKHANTIDVKRMMSSDYDLIWMNSIRDIPLVNKYRGLHRGNTKFMYVDRGNVLLNFKRAGLKRLFPKMLIRQHLMNSMRGWLDYYIAISVDQFKYAETFFSGRTDVRYIMIAPHEEFKFLNRKKTFNGALTVARLDDRQKDISFLIKGIERLKERYPDIDSKEVLRIAGTGIDEKKYKNMVKELGLHNNITFLGFISGSKLINAYNNASFYVSTSKWEGLGRSLLEAMACGLPLLINENINTTIKEGPRTALVRDLDNGMIYLAGDVDDLAEKFYWMYNDDKAIRKLSANALLFMKQFSFDRVIEKYTDIIGQL
ncbi:glycosyltransferase [Candidatus Marsarchaeota archaeon]|nr:glycosyltransferase [Candidatus Marsarchaeota archaeon]